MGGEIHRLDRRLGPLSRMESLDAFRLDRNEGTQLRVLVATDGSAESLAATKFAARVMPAGAEVTLLVVMSYSVYPSAAISPGYDGASVTRARLRRAVEAAVRRAREVLERAGIATTVRYRFGNVAEEILAEVQDSKPHLLVMGRRRRTGLARLIDASVSSRVLQRSQLPVLVASSTG